MAEARHVILAGGGTAGHTSPMIAVAGALQTLAPQLGVSCVGTERGIETEVVPAAGLELDLIDPVPVPRGVNPRLALVPAKLVGAVRQTIALLQRRNAAIVVGFGGYVSAPAYLAARRLRIPIVVHEGNAVPGMANRLGARLGASAVFTTFPDTELPRARYVGMPLRPGVLAGPQQRAANRARAAAGFDLDPAVRTVVVTGGSQGARRLNEAFLGAATDLSRSGIQVLHVVGKRNDATPPEVSGMAYRTVHYVDAMADAYAVADLLVCRAGANTVIEAAGSGLPAVYVPLPHGNGEQARNAAPVAEAGGGLIVADEAMTTPWVLATIPGLVADGDGLARMGAAAAGIFPTDAAEQVAATVAELAGPA